MALHHTIIWAIAALLLPVASAVLTVSSSILVIAASESAAKSAASGLRGYGIPYQTAVITSRSGTLPALSTSPTVGNFGGIIVTAEGLLSSAQLNTIYSYQSAFKVRLVQWDASPSSSYGTKYAISSTGCCDSLEQLVSFTNTSAFPTAGLRVGAGVSTKELWHNPATITNSSIATEIASFAAAGSFKSPTTAAVINNIGGREQMVWFVPFELDWAHSSNFLQHAVIHWLARGLYLGHRRVLLSPQVDDMHLPTNLYTPSGAVFRLRAADMEVHKSWIATINAKLNAGSKFFLEIAHNGNGNIDNATVVDRRTCSPGAIFYVNQPYTSNSEWAKPLGTGIDCWPTTPTSFVWSPTCIALDTLENWFSNKENLNTFAHISHTFTHMSLDNATYADASREVTFNQAWLTTTGIAEATLFSPNSLIPPAITGVNNGDVLRAWKDNGITSVVGDNTRPALLNTNNEHWPLITTVARNGYDGYPIIPRWATNIYFNCDTTACILAEYGNTLAEAVASFTAILEIEKAANTMHLLALRHDAFMFHQANMRQIDVPSTTLLDGTTQKLSLLQLWVETVAQEMVRLTTWPILSKKSDEIATQFLNRMARDACKPDLRYNYDSTNSSIVSVTVSAASSTCAAPIPVTFPGPVTDQGTATAEQLGTDPLTLWVQWAGQSQTFTLQAPISV